jgi:lathosterol oxidase
MAGPPGRDPSALGFGAAGGFEPVTELRRLLATYAQVLFVYYAFSFFLHYVSPQRHKKNVRSPAATQSPEHTRRDALRAMLPLAIKALCVWGGQALHSCGYGQMYDGPILPSWGAVDVLQLGATVLALDFFHDTWFYFVHRWLHTRTMMRYVHYMHHESRVPSAFTGSPSFRHLTRERLP